MPKSGSNASSCLVSALRAQFLSHLLLVWVVPAVVSNIQPDYLSQKFSIQITQIHLLWFSVFVSISSAFLLYALLCLPRQTALTITSVQRCQDLASPLDSVFSGETLAWQLCSEVGFLPLLSWFYWQLLKEELCISIWQLKSKLLSVLVVLLWSSTQLDNHRVKNRASMRICNSANEISQRLPSSLYNF